MYCGEELLAALGVATLVGGWVGFEWQKGQEQCRRLFPGAFENFPTLGQREVKSAGGCHQC